MPSRDQGNRSPSPADHSAPVSSVPGERAQRLQAIFDEALKHTLKPCSYDNFSSCFPTPAKYEPDALREFYHTFVGRLDSQCHIEFKNLMDERAVVPSLNKLDALLKEAENRRAASPEQETPDPPHLLPPDAILSAHLAPFLNEQSAVLSSRLSEVQKSNTALAEEIAAQRQEMDALVRGLEVVVADVEGAAATLNDAPEVRGVDEDLEAYAKMVGTG